MIRVATAPMNWNSDDLPDLRPLVPVEQVLEEMVQAGYEGTEYGTGLPADPAELAPLLARYGLSLASNFCWVAFEDRGNHEREITQALAVARTLSAMRVRELILGLRGSEERIALAGRVPSDGSAGLAEDQWRALTDGVHALARSCEPLGVRLSVHPHAGSFVETREELDILFRRTDPRALGLCVDAGHLVYGGGDPVEVVRTFGSRIRYVHLKDVNPEVLVECQEDGIGFLDALRRYIFCGLGKGSVDLQGFVEGLQRARFAGWMVIEEDTSPDLPLVAARRNRRYLREVFGI
jgi:inosose dehydratase